MIICIEINIESVTSDESGDELSDEVRGEMYEAGEGAIIDASRDQLVALEVSTERPDFYGEEAVTLLLDCGDPWVQPEEVPA